MVTTLIQLIIVTVIDAAIYSYLDLTFSRVALLHDVIPQLCRLLKRNSELLSLNFSYLSQTKENVPLRVGDDTRRGRLVSIRSARSRFFLTNS